MQQKNLAQSFKSFAALSLLAATAMTQLTGCFAIPVPPIPITITLTGNSQIVAENFTGSAANVTVGAFCDFFDAEALEETLRQNGGELIADLVQITGAEVQSVNVSASEGDFSTFNSASISLEGANGLPIGAATANGGLGSSFSMSQDMPVDLLNDLGDGQCGAAVIRLVGTAPEEDITFTTTATILVYTQVTLF